MKRKSIPKGYQFPSSVQPHLDDLHRTYLPISIGAALSSWLVMALCAAIGQNFWAFGWQPWLALHVFVLWPLCSCGLRGLENLTHEASHYNWGRNHKNRNDLIADWLCARWVFITTAQFRDTHFPHHYSFGTDDDSCFGRNSRAGTDHLNRKAPMRFLVATLRQLPTYIVDYWSQFSGKPKTLTISLMLHGFLVCIGSILMEKFWLVWILYFVVPFLFPLYLPFHRLVAESEKHRYEGAESVFGSTFSHLGKFQRWFLHPHGDGFHLLHHIDPKIPHWEMSRAHQLFLRLDPEYRKGEFRMSVFQDPKSGFKEGGKETQHQHL